MFGKKSAHDPAKTRRTELEESLQEVISITEEAIQLLNESNLHPHEVTLLHDRLKTVKAVATDDPQPHADSGGLYQDGGQPS